MSSRLGTLLTLPTRHSWMTTARRILPGPTRVWLRSQQQRLSVWPPRGWVRFGSLRRLTPISRTFGLDRGQPIDRYYIEQFIGAHASDIHGDVLEVADAVYTTRFGGAAVTQSHVLHVDHQNPKATMVADLSQLDNPLPSDGFDCIILTQTLPFIYDTRSTLRSLHRTLKPDGVLLATFNGISHISRYDMNRWGDYWRFTTLSARKLFEEVFAPSGLSIESRGNVLAATAFLNGLAAEELRRRELDYPDPDYQLLIAVRARKQRPSP